MTFFTAANFVSFLLRSSSPTVLFGCADCARGWGFPLLVSRRGGYALTNYDQPAALVIDVLTALAGSLALGWVMARRLPP